MLIWWRKRFLWISNRWSEFAIFFKVQIKEFFRVLKMEKKKRQLCRITGAEFSLWVDSDFQIMLLKTYRRKDIELGYTNDISKSSFFVIVHIFFFSKIDTTMWDNEQHVTYFRILEITQGGNSIYCITSSFNSTKLRDYNDELMLHYQYYRII